MRKFFTHRLPDIKIQNIKKGDIKMDMWTVINGLIYLLAFGLMGWVLLDASKISKKRG
jgi:hypothetical protein